MDIRKNVEGIKNSINNRSYHSDEEFFQLLDQLDKITNTYNDFIYCSKLKVYIRSKIAAHNNSKGEYKLVQNAIDLNLDFANKYNDKETFISTYNLAALLNFNLSEYTKALEYFLKGLYVAKEINDEYNICKISNNIGDLFFRFKEYKIAYKYFLEANNVLKNKQENQIYFSLIVFTEYNISSSLLVLKEYNESLNHLLRLKEFIKKNNIKSFEIMVSSLSIGINVKITDNMNSLMDDYQKIINSSKYITNYSLNIFDAYCLAIKSFISINQKEETITLINLMKIVVEMLDTNKVRLVYYNLILDYALKFESTNIELINKNYKLYYESSTKDNKSKNENIAKALTAELTLIKTKLRQNEIIKENCKLYKLSNTDSLTSLYNRLYFNQELNRIFSTDNLNIALIIFDIDNLKEINDRFGHLYGDKILIEAARTLDLDKDEDINVFRYGGDEFITIITNKPESFSIKYIQAIQNNLRKQKSKDKNCSLSFSIGYTYTVSNMSNPVDIIKNADKALYQAKKAGKNTYIKYFNKIIN